MTKAFYIGNEEIGVYKQTLYILKEAYGPLISFLYGWNLFLVIQTGTIAAVGVDSLSFQESYMKVSVKIIYFSTWEIIKFQPPKY